MASWAEELPSGRFQARYTVPDGRRRSAGTFAHKSAAKKAAAVGEAAAAELGWRDPRAAQKTWAQWCATWWETRPVSPGTLARDTSPRDRHLMERWGATALSDITRHDVKAWAADMARSGLAPASVQRHVHLFSASLTAAVDAEVLVANVAHRLKLPGGQVDDMRFLTRDEFAQLLGQFAEPGFVALLAGTGVRYGEAVGLQRRRVSDTHIRIAEVWDDRTGSLKEYPKGRKIRDVPLPEWVGELLPPGDPMVFEPMVYTNWRKRVWLPALRRSGLGHVRIHDLRHTYASWLLQDGVALAEVGRLLGHVSPVTTQRYAHLGATPSSAVLAAVRDPRRTNVGKPAAE